MIQQYLVIYLKGCVRRKEREKSSILWFHPQMAAMAGAGPGQSWVPGIAWIEEAHMFKSSMFFF